MLTDFALGILGAWERDAVQASKQAARGVGSADRTYFMYKEHLQRT